MIRSLEQLRTPAANKAASRLAVAVAQDAEVLLAVDAARRMGIATAVLVGDEAEIRSIAAELKVDLSEYQIIH